MDFIKGYKPVPYSDFAKGLKDAFDSSGKNYPELAVAAEVNSTQTIKNAFQTEDQIVSDQLMTKILDSLNMNGFILYLKGEKYYFVKSKN